MTFLSDELHIVAHKCEYLHKNNATKRPLCEKPSEMQRIIYLKEGVNSLFILSIHVVLRKQLKVWHESFAWSNIPGIQGEGSEGPNAL